MFSLRHAAVRLLATRTPSVAIRPPSVASFSSISLRPSRIAVPTQFQRRWASSEAEAKKEEEAPISQLQPTPEQEVENAIHEDSAASQRDPEPIAESANLTEVTEEATTTVNETEPVQKAVDSAPSFDDAVGAAANLTGDLTGPPRGERKPFRDVAEPKPSVYVGNLFFDVTENDLQKEFERFGTVEQVRLIRDARGLSKGFGYLRFQTTEQAQAAIDDMNQQLFEGRRMMVAFAHQNSNDRRHSSSESEHRPVNAPSKTLFIGNMSFEMTDRDLNNMFKGIRNVIDVRVAIDRRTGQPRGFAHADFVDVKSAMEAMKVLSEKDNYGRKLRVDYSFGPSSAPRNTPR